MWDNFGLFGKFVRFRHCNPNLRGLPLDAYHPALILSVGTLSLCPRFFQERILESLTTAEIDELNKSEIIDELDKKSLRMIIARSSRLVRALQSQPDFYAGKYKPLRRRQN